jgi:hypothetical protein
VNRIAAILLVLAAGCGGTWIPEATDADSARVSAQWPGTTTAQLNQGRSLLLSRCGSCHQPPSPAEKVAASWPGEVQEMAVRAKLSVDDAALVERYLVAFAKDQPRTATP